MYKIIPNLGKQVSVDTDILSADNNFIIRYDSKEDKQNAINKIFSSIVTKAHCLNNKIHTSYVFFEIYKKIILLLNKKYKTIKIYNSVAFYKLYKTTSKPDFIKNILESLKEEFEVNDYDYYKIIYDSLLIPPLSTKIEKEPLFNFNVDISDFDLLSEISTKTPQLYSRDFSKPILKKDNKYVITDSYNHYYTLAQEYINIDKNNLIVYKENILDLNIKINLYQYLSKDKIDFINSFNNVFNQFMEIEKLNSITDAMLFFDNFEINNNIEKIDNIIEKLKNI